MFTIVALVASAGIAFFLFKLATAKPRNVPPGPKGVPLLGNIFDLPPKGSRDWVHWESHKEQYGNVTSLTVFGSTIIVLHDYASAFEILERKCGSSAERPHAEFMQNICHWGHNVALQPRDDYRHRLARRQFHAFMGTAAAMSRHEHVQDVETRRFLLRVLRKPETFWRQIRKEAGSVILDLAYGYTAEPDANDPLVDLIETALEQISVASQPGAWAVDFFPWLRFVPDWFPGTAWKRTGKEFAAAADASAERPFKFVEMMRAKGTAVPSFVSNLHDQAGGRLEGVAAHSAMWTAQSMYAGGADTTVSTTALFFMAMMLHPEVQHKAREEIDRVVGSERLPEMGDRARLPYIEAVVKECLRWRPVLPAGLTHKLTADFEYDGYFLPKGAMVIPAVWDMVMDSKLYTNPAAFNPDRFMGPQPEIDPRNIIFGFGRRICPGRLLAQSSVFLTVAKTLAVFDIAKALDAKGNVIEPDTQMVAGLVSHPAPFEARIVPRSDRHAELVLEVEKTHPTKESSAKELATMTSW
ncbi:hypothetical protein CBER1_09786 [Cercospora berteroae]|uniref:O-methylsterigmatocystin oxidoreductase n=1 Tax=Cercospora berteroae TaxID=357750 RepID=A0A2S6BY29_9PEZI|nr:hypothetical protein CBER1_09786 [Cercospora berteroae]